MNPRLKASPEAAPPRILVVEDEILIRTLLAEVLREEGATVIEAATADEAWSFLVSGGEVDLIVSDLHMPGSLNGLQLAQRIRDQGLSLPIIITSGNPGPGSFIKIGVFIQKPYEFYKLIALIGKLLNLPTRPQDP